MPAAHFPAVQDANAAVAAGIVTGVTTPAALPPTAPAPAAAGGSSSSNNIGEMVGIAAGAVVVLAVLSAAVYIISKRLRGRARARAKPDASAVEARSPAGVPPQLFTASSAGKPSGASAPGSARAAPGPSSHLPACGSPLLRATADTSSGHESASWGALPSNPTLSLPALPGAAGVSGPEQVSGDRVSSLGASVLVLPNTMAQGELQSQVECALDNMAAAEPAEPLLRRWDLLPGREAGGQAVVAFASDRNESLMECAIKCVPSSE